MIDGRALGRVANRLSPGYLDRVDWGNIWERPLSEGSAFEWAMLAAIAGQAQTQGWKTSFPILDTSNGPSLFRLWNEIPRHHGAQPGHASVYRHDRDLQERFLQSLIPKLVLAKQRNFYSLFREGCPYHKIMVGQDYNERPDIIILPGQPTEGFPRVVRNGTEVEFSYVLKKELVVSGRLRVVNSPTIPCRVRRPREGVDVPITGIVECSVNKPLKVAKEQLQRYENLFSRPSRRVPQILVTGNRLATVQWASKFVDLSATSTDSIEADFRAAAKTSLVLFGIV